LNKRKDIYYITDKKDEIQKKRGRKKIVAIVVNNKICTGLSRMSESVGNNENLNEFGNTVI
jgi:hypothetical protein